jgi:hypothetical protein
MTKEHPRGNTDCCDEDHNQHLCYFVSYGYHVMDDEDYKSKVIEPQFKCYYCGRVAHLAKSLCKPVEL